MTQDPRIESLARALCVAAGQEWNVPYDPPPVVNTAQFHTIRARELLTLLDWAKANGELGHERVHRMRP